MQTYKQYIAEMKIKLRGMGAAREDNRKHGQAFIKDLDSVSTVHPFNDKLHVIGNAHVHVSYDGDGIHIHDIVSFEQGSGAGTKALQVLIKLADKHNLSLNLTAKGYASTKTSQLKKWYKKFNFEHDEAGSQEMTRKPR
jgi:hypothetical protein